MHFSEITQLLNAELFVAVAAVCHQMLDISSLPSKKQDQQKFYFISVKFEKSFLIFFYFLQKFFLTLQKRLNAYFLHIS